MENCKTIIGLTLGEKSTDVKIIEKEVAVDTITGMTIDGTLILQETKVG